MFGFHPADYGKQIAEILALAENGHRLLPLAGGACANEEARDTLRKRDAAGLFAKGRILDREFAEAARSGLFLYFSCLEDAHAIAQQIGSTTGSYWHGIMHRQEPDFSNAAYWFRRVKQHEIFPALRSEALEMLDHSRTSFAAGVKSGTKWDPFRFIDACEQVHRKPGAALESDLRKIQRVEWQVLFDFCCRRAVGIKL